jgi:DnaJ family protein C protein 9
MAILGDPEKRELYDQTGSIAAADIDGDAVKSLYKFLRTLFKQVTSFVQIRLFFAFFCFF